MSKKDNFEFEDNAENAKRKAKGATKAAGQAIEGFYHKTAAAMKSPTAKEVYKVVGYVAVGAVITGLTGFKINIPGK